MEMDVEIEGAADAHSVFGDPVALITWNAIGIRDPGNGPHRFNPACQFNTTVTGTDHGPPASASASADV
jgi:hypothetical protein